MGSAAAEWTLVPASADEVADLRTRCRAMVRKRAAIAAGVAAVPLPGVDLLSDVSLFTLLVEDVNRAFGLTEAQVARLAPRYRILAYQAAVGVGGMLVGKAVTRELILKLLGKAGGRLVAKSAAKFVPLAGSVASAAIGFEVFRRMGYQHVEACAAVAQELLVAKNA
jgi:uncharacterized protein (DUF697 family)